MTDDARIDAIYRYPVKGLSPERLPAAQLAPAQTIPFDRAYAIENGPCGFDPAAPAYFPKIRFLMLMRNERLGALRTRFEEASHRLTIEMGGRELASGDLRTAEGRAAIERFFAEFCASELRGPPRVLHGEGHSFSDVARKVVSIINLASVQAIEAAAGAPVDPLRFRGNLLVAGWQPWREFEFMDRELVLGRARVKVVKRIVRCAATEVDPATGIRDLPIPRVIEDHFGHVNCGVYAEVVEGGEIAPGTAVVEAERRLPL